MTDRDALRDVRTKRTGRCLCNTVQFEFDGEPTDASFCHCSLCRRLTGSAFGCWCETAKDAFRWTAGGNHVTTYAVTERLQSLFCRTCGSVVQARHESWPDCRYLPLGALDDDHGIVPEYHQFTASRAAWFRIHDALMQYPAWPDEE